MCFREYVEILDRLEEMEKRIIRTVYPLEKRVLLEKIDEIKRAYELAIIESGEYPTF